MVYNGKGNPEQNFKQIQPNKGPGGIAGHMWPLRRIIQMSVRNGWAILWWGVGRVCKVWKHKGHKEGKWEERGFQQSTFIRDNDYYSPRNCFSGL